MNLETALDRFLVQLQADGRSHHTIGQYRRHIRLLSIWLAGEGHSREVEHIDHEALALFLASQAARTRPDGKQKRATAMNTLRSSLRTFFSYLHRAGYIPLDPGRLIKRAACGTPPPKTLSREDQELLLTTLAQGKGQEAERDHMLFRLMLATGIRLSAALGLNAEDLNLSAGEISIRTKGNRIEKVFLGEEIRNHLERYMVNRNTGPLFACRSGRLVSARHIQRRFRQWLKKAGIKRPASPHSLRHRFATDLYRRTGDILLVKAALHHRSITSTLVYARADEERLRAVIN